MEENRKIAEELQLIEERIKNITDSKGFDSKGPHSDRSKLTTHRTQDITQVSAGQSIIERRDWPDAQSLINSIGSKE